MISALLALVLSLLVQVQSPNVPVATKMQALQLAVVVINLAQAQQTIASTTPAVTVDATTTVSAPLSQGVDQPQTSTNEQTIQQITNIVSPPAPTITRVPLTCVMQVTPTPAPHGGPSQPLMAGWDVKIQWFGREAYQVDKNATFSFSPQVNVQYYKSNQLDLYGNGTASYHQMATSTTYTLTINVNNPKILPQSTCSVTVDLTDSIAATGIPLENVFQVN